MSLTLKFVACISWGVQMGAYQQRLAVAKRLSLILHDAANLNFQLSELNSYVSGSGEQKFGPIRFQKPGRTLGAANQPRTSGVPRVVQRLSRFRTRGRA